MSTKLSFLLICSLSFSLSTFLKHRPEDRARLEALQNSITDYNSVKFDAPTNGLFSIMEQDVTLAVNYNSATRTLTLEKIKEVKLSNTLLAVGYYKGTRYSKGWDLLKIQTYSNASIFLQHYAAGILEGYLTHTAIIDYNNNLKFYWKDDQDLLKEVRTVLQQIDDNLKKNFNLNYFEKMNQKEFIKNVSLYTNYVRLYGVFNGFKEITTESSFDLIDIFFNNSEGNTEDYKSLVKAFKKTKENTKVTKDNLQKQFGTTDPHKIYLQLRQNWHCSSIAHLVDKPDGTKDILAGHETWQGYNEMVRTAKLLDISNEGSNLVIGLEPYKINYSSYPGVIFSGDDFYLNSHKVVALQTTLSQIDRSAYSEIDINAYIPEFMRLMTVNTLAKTAADWVELYGSFKNHMYVTEWLVVDYKKLDAINNGEEIEDGLIFVLDEVIGLIKHEDATSRFLEEKSAGSFNQPYFQQAADKAGISKAMPGYSFFNKDFNSRYFLMKEIIGAAKNLADFQHVMEFNSYKHDRGLKFDKSVTDPSEGIAGRGDLLDKNNVNGGTDYKVVNAKLVGNLEAIYKQGPTTDLNPNLTTMIMKDLSALNGYIKGIPNIQKFEPFLFGDSSFNKTKLNK